VKSKAGRWMCFVGVLFCTALAEVQRTSPTPAADVVTQFDGKFRASNTKGVEEAYLGKLFRSSHAANLVKLHSGMKK